MNRKVSILGSGISGIGAAQLALAKGDRPFVSDHSVIEKNNLQKLESWEVLYEENGHTDIVLNADLIVKSPGIPTDIPILSNAKDLGIEIISEIEYAAQFSKATIIGVTGTNGKTTTVHLIHHIMKNAKLDVAMVGNVGTSMAAMLAKRDYEYLVVELSSFQIDGLKNIQIPIAIVLNVSPDHLDRYNSFEDYVKSKLNLFNFQKEKDLAIFCQDDIVLSESIKKYESIKQFIPISANHPLTEGAWIDKDRMVISHPSLKQNFNMEISQLTIGGKHNLYNTMAAAIVANALLIRKEKIRESLSNFTSVEHRLEWVLRLKGREFVNDSKATNVNATWYALESANNSIVWIAGGVDKGNDYELLKPMVREKVRVIICLGIDNLKIHEAFGQEVEIILNTTSMDEAVNMAFKMSEKGEQILLSPACASFDLFENYQERGKKFKEAVKNL